MTAVAPPLSNALRDLVDSRLDTVERALLQGNTPRAERRSILEDIETQILDMLAVEAPDHEPTRADLLRVLARLDPPEAFTGEEVDSVRPRVERGTAAVADRTPPVAKSGYATTGILACVGGLVTLGLGLPLCAFTMLFAESATAVVAVVCFIVLTGAPAGVLGILHAMAIRESHGRLRGLTCAAIGISALPISIAGLLLGFCMAAAGELAIIGGAIFICVLAVVGAIHLTYRSLEVLVGAPQHPA
jgi:hypothetical protein